LYDEWFSVLEDVARLGDGTSKGLNPNPLLDDKVQRDTDMDILIIIASLIAIIGGGLSIKRWQDDE
jgi:hypothetical protein